MKRAIIVNSLWGFVGLSGCFSVLFGAWLAHAGKSLPVESYSRLASAVEYQLYHTLTLFISIIAYKIKPSNWLLSAILLFFLGIILFSGSLYFKTFFNLAFWGALVPFGGISFALAWLCIMPAGRTFLGKN